ncbi:MAG TPA: nucleotidyltransferase domain-containing protein [Bryobacteraceae bacterium]|jgi:predicted nucleotidyltransferase|nr:nucleotidyltransferase domain-containing protein [Bryobacteraceae bacterium]
MRHDLLHDEIAHHPYPLLFATISGAHLYGFASPDSDYDLRGAHILPASEALAILPKKETLELSTVRDGVEIDYVTHDILKFFEMLLKRNGYVLEQLYSPLVVRAMPEHEELKDIAQGCITRHHAHHYLGFADTQWRLVQKSPPRLKPLLYTYRVLLTGIHLMRTGEVEANLPRLNETRPSPGLAELIERKTSGSEHEQLSEAEINLHEKRVSQLRGELAEAAQRSTLPDEPRSRAALNDLLIRLRLRDAPDKF